MTEPHVFISYGPTDQAYAQQVADHLQQQGFTVWLNDGKRRWPTIEKAIRACGAAVVILTPEAAESASVQREVLLVESLLLPILPILRSGSPDVLLQQETPPFDALNGEMPDAAFCERLAQHLTKSDSVNPAVSVSTQLSNPSNNLDDLPTDLDPTAEQPQTPYLMEAVCDSPVEPVMHGADWQPVTRMINGMEMVLVPPGCFMMGSDDLPNALPIQMRCIAQPFWIGRYPVTNAQYHEAVRSKICEVSRWAGDIRFNDPDQPAVGVSWGDALKFAHWKQMRLPTETEWEYAARGPEGWLWPWGNDFVSENLIYSYNAYSRTAPVGNRPSGASWVGTLDMSGNTWDWCLSAWRDDYSAAENNLTKPASEPRVLRGGSFLDLRDQTRATVRTSDDPIFGNVNISFRLVCMAPVLDKN